MEHTKNSQNSTRRKQERFTKEDVGGNQGDDKMFDVINRQEHTVKNDEERPPHVYQNDKMKRQQQVPPKTRSSRSPPVAAVEWETGTATLDTVWQGLVFLFFCRIDTRYILENIIEVIHPYMVYN